MDFFRSYEFYKLLHFIGIFTLMFAYGGLIMFHNRGGQKGDPARKPVAMLHGIAMFLVLLGGFGLLARLGVSFPWPGWVFVKIGVWVLLGGLIAMARKRAHLVWPLYGVVILLGAVAAYMATNKPF